MSHSSNLPPPGQYPRYDINDPSNHPFTAEATAARIAEVGGYTEDTSPAVPVFDDYRRRDSVIPSDIDFDDYQSDSGISVGADFDAETNFNVAHVDDVSESASAVGLETPSRTEDEARSTRTTSSHVRMRRPLQTTEGRAHLESGPRSSIGNSGDPNFNLMAGIMTPPTTEAASNLRETSNFRNVSDDRHGNLRRAYFEDMRNMPTRTSPGSSPTYTAGVVNYPTIPTPQHFPQPPLNRPHMPQHPTVPPPHVHVPVGIPNVAPAIPSRHGTYLCPSGTFNTNGTFISPHGIVTSNGASIGPQYFYWTPAYQPSWHYINRFSWDPNGTWDYSQTWFQQP